MYLVKDMPDCIPLKPGHFSLITMDVYVWAYVGSFSSAYVALCSLSPSNHRLTQTATYVIYVTFIMCLASLLRLGTAKTPSIITSHTT